MLRQLKQTASEAMRHYSINITASRLHPSLATGKNYLRRSVISVRGVPAGADVLPLFQGLLRHGTTLRARLRSSPRIHFDNLNTRTFSVAFENLKELAPASIQHGTGEPVVPRHPTDVQAFHRDQTVPVNQLPRDLVVLIPPVIRHCGVGAGYCLAGLCASSTSLALPAQRPLLHRRLA